MTSFDIRMRQGVLCHAARVEAVVLQDVLIVAVSGVVGEKQLPDVMGRWKL